MFFTILIGMAAVAAAAGYYVLKSMRKCDVLCIVANIMVKTKFINFLSAVGLSERLRPKFADVTASNGFTLKRANPLFNAVIEPALKLKTREDDVFIATYPKAGTTWMQEIAWLICNNADIETAKKEPLACRSPFLEAVDVLPYGYGIQSIESWPENKQRVIKTHFPYQMLPEDLIKGGKGKIICVARNPKDLCVSFHCFHMMSTALEKPGTWSEFLTRFASGNIACGSWFQHTLKYWEEFQKDKERIYFVTYESLRKDLRAEIGSISKFLGKELTDQQIDAIAQRCTFESMSKNLNPAFAKMEKNVGLDFSKHKFMRKGQVGDWKNHFTINENSAFDELYEEKMKGTGLQIPFELV